MFHCAGKSNFDDPDLPLERLMSQWAKKPIPVFIRHGISASGALSARFITIPRTHPALTILFSDLSRNLSCRDLGRISELV